MHSVCTCVWVFSIVQHRTAATGPGGGTTIGLVNSPYRDTVMFYPTDTYCWTSVADLPTLGSTYTRVERTARATLAKADDSLHYTTSLCSAVLRFPPPATIYTRYSAQGLSIMWGAGCLGSPCALGVYVGFLGSFTLS